MQWKKTFIWFYEWVFNWWHVKVIFEAEFFVSLLVLKLLDKLLVMYFILVFQNILIINELELYLFWPLLPLLNTLPHECALFLNRRASPAPRLVSAPAPAPSGRGRRGLVPRSRCQTRPRRRERWWPGADACRIPPERRKPSRPATASLPERWHYYVDRLGVNFISREIVNIIIKSSTLLRFTRIECSV